MFLLILQALSTPVQWPTASPTGQLETDSPTATAVTSTTTSAAPSMCIGNTVDWVDIYGDGCDWYEGNDLPGCPIYGSFYEGDMGVANDNCCYCVGTDVSATTL